MLIKVCHKVPSQWKDNKRVMVCKFVKRKSKIAILKEKKEQRNFQIFINEHLSKENRRLFSAASQLKCDIGLKYVWLKNGAVYEAE